MKSDILLNAAFEQRLEMALKHYKSPEWLEANSPLAQPYFLGACAGQAANRGQALQRLIQQACEYLWGGPLTAGELDSLATREQGRKYLAILELRYFQRSSRPANASIIWDTYLHVSKAQFHRYLNEAIHLLGQAMLLLARPALGLERPQPPVEFYGREQSLALGLEQLRGGQSVAISGASGIGKTSLAAALSRQWAGPVFWYTIRPCLNDTPENFLFALAFFLHQNGASGLWQQVLANQGQIKNLELARELARHALAQLARPPLLVIDEADALRPEKPTDERLAYNQILGLLEGLQAEAPCLLAGQRAIISTPTHIELGGLGVEQIQAWFAAAGVSLHAQEVQALSAYTGGSLRSLAICRELLKSGFAAAEALAQFKHSPGVKPLFDRLWARLEPGEQRLMLELAVFRSSAPADLWPEGPGALQRLKQRGLVLCDHLGGVALLPSWADLILAETTAEQKEALHAWAAGVRAERGEYTEAAYHCWKAGSPAAAVTLWYANMEPALALGQVGAAAHIFAGISANQLAEPERRRLALIRARLAEMVGDAAGGLRSLALAEWPAGARLTAQAHHARGRFFAALGDNPAALREYQSGLNVLAEIAHQQALLFTSRAARFGDEGEMEAAWLEVQRGQYALDDTRGTLWDATGHPDQALECYYRALEIARQSQDPAAVARTQNNIGSILAMRGDDRAADLYLAPAIEYYKKSGDLVAAHRTQINRVVGLMQAGKYPEALPPAVETAEFFLSLHYRALLAFASMNLAEIYVELGQSGEARRWAGLALSQEQTDCVPFSLYILARAETLDGDYARAEEHLREAIRQAQPIQDQQTLAFAWRSLGQLHRLHGQAGLAQEAFEKALALFELLHLPNEVQKTRDQSGGE